MKTLITISAAMKARVKERGSALLVSLMVLVGLSLLGLGFVAMSESETAIATNERNATQTLQIAEAGGLMVVEWFQNPDWALAAGLMPVNTPAIKVVRNFTIGAVNYTGQYKSTAGTILFDKPYKPKNEDRFYGTEDNPDILINDRTDPVFLAQFNVRLFNSNGSPATIAANCEGCDNSDGGRVTEIRIYAPPTDGAILNTEVGWNDPTTSGIPVGRGFYIGGSRFGIATIRVTATKYNQPNCGPYVAGCDARAQKQSKFVISEWPFPGPQGPVQSNAQIATTGDFKVHWGKVTATDDAFLKRPYVGLPWVNAYDRTRLEQGYEAAGQGGTNASQMWITDPAGTYKVNRDWMYELLQRSYEDPWYQARSRQRIMQIANVTDPHATRYRNSTLAPNGPICDPCNAGDAATPGQSNMFQFQTQNLPDDRIDSLFPRIDYDFWKQIAQAADDQDNVYYLQWVTKDNFKDRQGNTKTFREWVDVMDGDGTLPGFYFFDTQNGLNPQNNGGGILTPQVDLSGGKMLMRGFVYLNSATFSPSGLGGYDGYYNMPGEYFRNIGFRKVEEDPALTNYKDWMRVDQSIPCVPATGANCVTEGAADIMHNYQDLAWSLDGSPGTKNGEFDVFVTQRTVTRSSSPTTLTNEWFVVQYYVGCTPGDYGQAGVNCSEPHEPYLNFVYPQPGTWNPLSPDPIIVRTPDPTSAADRRRKKTTLTPPTAIPACTVADTQADCTSYAYDKDGGLVPLNITLDGVFYNEGTFVPTGNPHYFGSLLFEKSISGAGTPDIWFDERLIKGDWPPGYFGFPRVYITTHETN
jgi:hypothetical protein